MRWRSPSRWRRRATRRLSFASRRPSILTKGDDGWGIRNIGLELEARVPGIDAQKFQALAEKAQAGLPDLEGARRDADTLSAKLA